MQVVVVVVFLSTLSLRRATCLPGFCRITAEFLSTLSLRRATAPPYNLMIQHTKFLSTLSLRRATERPIESRSNILNFYPRSPCGERHLILIISQHSEPFLSTLSLRRATSVVSSAGTMGKSFLSTLSLRRATIGPLIFNVQPRNFYPRSPCGERLSEINTRGSEKIFLSTLSLRRATRVDFFFCVLYHYFYPRSPCGERRAMETLTV